MWLYEVIMSPKYIIWKCLDFLQDFVQIFAFVDETNEF